MDDENITFAQTKITMQSIKTAIDYIESQIEKAIGGEVELKRALIIAIDIEKSLLESAFLKVFKLSGPKAQKIQSRLLEETGGHLERLMEWQSNIR